MEKFLVLVLVDEQVRRDEPSCEVDILDADHVGARARAQVGLGHDEVLPPFSGGGDEDLPGLVGPVVRDVVPSGVD